MVQNRFVFTSGLLVALIYAQINNENVIFDKISEINLSRASWRVTLILDLNAYDGLFEEAERYLSWVEKAVNRTIQQQSTNYSNSTFYLRPFRSLSEQVKHLKNTKNLFFKIFSSYNILHVRNKRAIIPIVSNVLSFLFGTPSADDFNEIKSAINKLGENQQKLTHVVKQSLTILNKTREEVRINRNRINKMIDGITDINKKLDLFDKELQETHIFKQFSYFHMELDSIITNAREIILETIDHFNALQLQINMLAAGRLTPSGILPDDLRSVLIQIERQLPDTLAFAVNPSKNLWAFYRQIKTQTAFEDGKIYVILNIPLVNFAEKFDLYKAFSIPVVDPSILKHKKISNSNDKHITAHYILESQIFAISKSRSRYIILNDKETESCLNNFNNFCKVNSAIFPINIANQCVISLFLNNKKGIKSYCRTLVFPNDVLPRAVYIRKGIWAVSTAEAMKLRLTCDKGELGNNKDLTIKPPLDTIYLEPSCLATGNQLALPRFHEFSSKKEIDITPKFRHKIENFSFWEPLKDRKHINFEKEWIPKKLKDMPEINMNSLIDSLDDIDKVQIKDSWLNDSNFFLFTFIAIIVGLVGFIIFKYVKEANLNGKSLQVKEVKSNDEDNHEIIPLQDLKETTVKRHATRSDLHKIKVDAGTTDTQTTTSGTSSFDITPSYTVYPHAH